MSSFFTTAAILVLTLLLSDAFAQVCNIKKDYKAKGDGKTDNYKAFAKAFKECSKVVVPKGDFVIKKRLFLERKGFELEIEENGCMTMPKKRKQWPNNKKHGDCFMRVKNTDDVKIYGKGIIDGKGEEWWKERRENKTAFAPTLLCVSTMKRFNISQVTLQNSPHFTLGIANCENCVIDNVKVYAPDDAPNTDGIKVQGRNITVTNNEVRVGDDNVAVNQGTKDKPTKNITIAHNTFGSGHGTSIGSVGKHFKAGYIQDVYIFDNVYDKTDNGFRIKTWIGGSGLVDNIVVHDLTMYSVKIPVYINQKYCDNSDKKTCPDEKKHPNSVQISNISIRNVTAYTSEGSKQKGYEGVVALFECAKRRCGPLILENLQLLLKKNTPKMYCKNAYGRSSGHMTPPSCIAPRFADAEDSHVGEPLKLSR